MIETVRKYPERIGKLYAGRNGILGALREELIDTAQLSNAEVALLRSTPSGAFGSCRYKLKSLEENRVEYERLIDVFKAHNIGYFFYNGGGDSQDTAHKVSQISQSMGYPITCIGVPKTIDNDLPFSDCSPGFGSVAKYVAVSTREAGLDVESMCETSTKIFVLEVMGRHAGWIAAASSLAANNESEPPHIILFPEVVLDEERFLARVKQCVETYGYCVIVASEGLRNKAGKFMAEAGGKDAFGHAQLGGVAPVIANLCKDKLGYKFHWAVSDYLQRSARHIASAVDVKQAYAVGSSAVTLALDGQNAIMPIIVRKSSSPYVWEIGSVPLADVANQEKKMPSDFISEDGFGVTAACRSYLQPLIEGEDYPEYQQGLPIYLRKSFVLTPPKLPAFKV